MKERPILFSGPMVNAIRDGRKTQTRRVLKPSPPATELVHNKAGIGYDIFTTSGDRGMFHVAGPVWAVRDLMGMEPRWKCPYGQPGDRLWVKETFCQFDAYGTPWLYRADEDEDGLVPFLMHGEGGSGGGVASTVVERWKPSIFMPRRASRILLEITAVRIERLQDISEEDSKAEGATQMAKLGLSYATTRIGSAFDGSSFRDGYQWLWESINGPGSWEVNPWVWVIEFKVIEGGKR